MYSNFAKYIAFLRRVAWRAKNFGRVLKLWKQTLEANRMAWRANQILDIQGYYGFFAALLLFVIIPSIHNGTDVKTKKRDDIKVSPNFLVVWTSSHLL